jgi:hypothetical protein
MGMHWEVMSTGGKNADEHKLVMARSDGKCAASHPVKGPCGKAAECCIRSKDKTSAMAVCRECRLLLAGKNAAERKADRKAFASRQTSLLGEGDGQK